MTVSKLIFGWSDCNSICKNEVAEVTAILSVRMKSLIKLICGWFVELFMQLKYGGNLSTIKCCSNLNKVSRIVVPNIQTCFFWDI